MFLLEHRREIAHGACVTGSAVWGGVRGGGELVYDLTSLKLYSRDRLEELKRIIEEQSRRYSSLLDRNGHAVDTLAVGGELLADMLRSGRVPEDVQAAYRSAYPDLAHRMDFGEAVTNYHGQHLVGFLNPVKGKLFEIKYADWLNDGHLPDGYHATLAPCTNQPGWDLAISGPDGHVAQLLQLKASDSVTYVRHAMEQYPDIQVVTTDEVYSKLALHGAAHAPLENAGLTEHVAGAADAGHIHMDFTPPLISLALIAFTTYRAEDLSVYAKARQFGERGTKSYLTYLLGGTAAVLAQNWWLGILAGMGSRWLAGRGRRQRELYRHLEEMVRLNERHICEQALSLDPTRRR
jgi:hypothetical protein